MAHPSIPSLPHRFIPVFLQTLGRWHSTKSYEETTAGHESGKDCQRLDQMNSCVIVSLFCTLSTVNAMSLNDPGVLAQMCGADSVISGGSDTSQALLPHYSQAGVESYRPKSLV